MVTLVVGCLFDMFAAGVLVVWFMVVVGCDLWVLGLVVADGVGAVWCWCDWLFGDLLIV